MGPLMATLLALTDASVSGGSGVPAVSMTSTPACWTAQSNDEPAVAAAASRTRRVASVNSGPVPSPGISVTRWVAMKDFLRFHAALRLFQLPTSQANPVVSTRPHLGRSLGGHVDGG